MNLSPVYIEISQGWLKALRENDGLDVRSNAPPNGQLTAACKRNLVLESCINFLQRKSWQPRARAVCAIPRMESRCGACLALRPRGMNFPNYFGCRLKPSSRFTR